MADDDNGRRSSGGSFTPSIAPRNSGGGTVTRTSSTLPDSRSYNAGVYPVRDPRSQQIIGYRNRAGQWVNEAGQVLGANGVGITNSRSGGGNQREPYLGEEMTPAELEVYRAETRAQRAEQVQVDYRAGIERQTSALAVNSGMGRKTLDGVVSDPYDRDVSATIGREAGEGGATMVPGRNGEMVQDTTSYRARVTAQQSRATSIFNGLGLSDIAEMGNSTFILSQGAVEVDATTGGRLAAGDQDLRVGARNSSQRPSSQKPQGENRLTVSGGLSWFRKLAVEDRAAYNSLVIQLRNAGYMGGEDHDLPLNGYTRAAGEAFAYAAADLADATREGDRRTLLQYLTDRGQGYLDYEAQQAADEAEANAEPEYQPVDRSYTDPEAVKQTAKEAAIAALGRKLTDEEEARFQAAFRGKEDGYYDAIDGAGRAKTAARVADPNLGAQAEAFIGGDEYDTERAGQALGNYAQVFQRMMGVA